VSPDENLVLMIGQDGNAFLRDRRTGETARFDLAIRWADGPQFSPDGRFFATGTQVASPKIWETEGRREVAELTGSVEVNSVAFSPEGSRIAAGSSGLNAMTVWEAGSYQRVLTFSADGSIFRRAAFSPDGNTIGARSLGGVLHLWRAPSWEVINEKEKAQAPGRP
jgi:WD40 repeat protein